MAANPFVRRFYPNRSGAGIPRVDFLLRRTSSAPQDGGRMAAGACRVPRSKRFCRRAYGWHLRRRSSSWQSPEQVRMQADYLKLHTRSHRQSVLERFDERIDDALNRRRHAAIA